MSNPHALGSLCHEAESSWAENVVTFTTLAHPLANGNLDLNLVHNKIDPQGIYQRRNEGSAYILGGIGGTFTARYDLYGHGSTMVGSPTLSQYETYLGRVWGNVALSATASTTLTGGTATAPTTTASATFSAGGLGSIGALGDGDGNGQMYPIGTHVTTTLNLLADLLGAPVNGAVLRPVAMIYPSSSPTSNAITGTRFRWQTGNMQYAMHGCFPMSVELSGLGVNGRPSIAITWGVSWWQYQNATFPNTVTAERSTPAVCAAGSLHVQDVGTSTRNSRQATDFTLTYTLGIVPIEAPAGVNAYQTIVGATRINDTIEGSWTEHADATTTSPVLPGYGTGTTNKLIMWTGNTIDGKQIGILLRNCCITSVPIQSERNGVNSFAITFRAHTGSTTTNDLTLAPFVLGFA